MLTANEEKVALMTGRDTDGETLSDPSKDSFDTHRNNRSGFKTSNVYFILLHLTLATLYTGLFWKLTLDYRQSAPASSESRVYSPAHEAVRFEKQRFNAELIIESEFIGEPTPESDLAWHNLLQNMNIKVPAADLEKINAASIGIPGEPGNYIAGLSVYHELHCLKRLRQHTWIDHYFPNQTAEDARLQRLHTDHCIDVLRQAILCHADTSLFTLQWSENSRMPRADFSNEHTCVNWEALDTWAGKRAVPEAKMKELKHPFRGKAFPDGHGSKLGAVEDQSKTILEHPSS